MEWLWIQQKFGDELAHDLKQDWCTVTLDRRPHPRLPDDIFKETHIYAEVEGSRASLFALKYGLEPDENE